MEIAIYLPYLIAYILYNPMALGNLGTPKSQIVLEYKVNANINTKQIKYRVTRNIT